jgi:hypothetical protein
VQEQKAPALPAPRPRAFQLIGPPRMRRSRP